MEVFFGKLAFLGESVHPFLRLNVDLSLGYLGFDGVEVDDGWRQEMNGNAGVIIICEVDAKIEVFQVQCNKSFIGGANNAVELAFGCLDVTGLGGDVVSVLKFVTTVSKSEAVEVLFLWKIGID